MRKPIHDVRLIAIGMHETQYENMLFTWDEIKIPENVDEHKWNIEARAMQGCATLWIGSFMRYHVHMRFGMNGAWALDYFSFDLRWHALCEPTSSACDECCRKSKSHKKTQMKRRIPNAKVVVVRLLCVSAAKGKKCKVWARFAGDAD